MYSNTQARGKTVSRSDSRYIYSLLYQGILAVFSKEVEVYHMITFAFAKRQLIPLNLYLYTNVYFLRELNFAIKERAYLTRHKSRDKELVAE